MAIVKKGTGFYTEGAPPVASGTAYTITGSFTPAAGDLLIVTLASNGASTACEFTSASLTDNLGGTWTNILYFSTPLTWGAGSGAGSMSAWYKVAVGGETSITPTFTQTTHTKNWLMADCFNGFVGRATPDPAGVNLSQSQIPGVTYVNSSVIAGNSTVGKGELAYVGLVADIDIGAATTPGSTGITGGTATTSIGQRYGQTIYQISTAQLPSTAQMSPSWTNTFPNVGFYGIVFYDKPSVSGGNFFLVL